MLRRLRLLTAGESHGPKIAAILDGLPSGLAVDVKAVDAELRRRQTGAGSGPRMRIEADHVQIHGGVLGGQTTGGPVLLEIENLDHPRWRDAPIPAMTVPRPGHADLVGLIKFGHPDLRPSLERASARETAVRVAAGALCRQFLSAFGIEIGGFVSQLGSVRADVGEGEARTPETLRRGAAHAESNPWRCPTPEHESAYEAALLEATRAQDSLGGVICLFALGVPPGLGSFTEWDLRLDARLAFALMSLPSAKGVEIGPAFAQSAARGSQVHDAIFIDSEGQLFRNTHRSGGLEAGVSTGGPIELRVALKPLSTLLAPLPSVDLAVGRPAVPARERSDFCAVPRAVTVGEALLATVLADALLDKLGGDSMFEIMPRWESLRRSRLSDLRLSGDAWRWNGPGPSAEGRAEGDKAS